LSYLDTISNILAISVYTRSMLQELKNLRDQLNKLKENIVKLGSERRQKEIGKKKLEASNEIINQAADIVSQLKEQKTEVSSSVIQLSNLLIEEINETYIKIKTLLSFVDTESQTENKMAKPGFDIKTAIALLPIMTGQEDVTKQLIDGILMYSTLINDDAHKTLIDFVLKTRLSSSAKLRLKMSYISVEALVIDMRNFLLTKKSAESIQAQLYRARQGRRSVESFGAEIEELFVNLTISQADGNDSRYDILRPMNEKSAIKRFADGLADPKLSTIISSRQFTSLPEAIRTAIDEQISSPNDDQISYYQHYQHRNNYRNNNGRYPHYRGNFRSNRGRNNTYGTQYYSNSNNRPYVSQSDPGQRTRQYFAPSAHRGLGPRGSPRPALARVQHIHDDTAPSTSVNTNENDNMQFFRE
jgi:hypothetical protein